MHAYYKENRDRLQKTMKSFLALVGPEIERIGGRAYEAAFGDIWEIYENDMLERFPYIGGDDVGGTKNLTEAYMLVAMGEYLKKYGATMEEIGHCMTVAYERRMLKMPKLFRSLMGKMLTNPKLLYKAFQKKDARNADNAARNPGSFETKTQIPPEAGYDFSYHNLVCPIANFARKYGYEAYMPYLCNLDYVMFGIVGVPLFREHTCFDSEYCDFKLKVGTAPMAYWPPVFSQGKGYK